MSEIKLTFEEPIQKKRTPEHFADWDPSERKARIEALGLPGFRANQIATHFFTHYNDAPETWSDFPTSARSLISESVLPQLITQVRSISCDDGWTRKDLWKIGRAHV